MKKFWVVILAALAALAVAAAYYQKYSGATVKIKTQPVARGDLIVSVSASGAIEPNFQVEVKSKASGEILAFDFEPGDYVTKGQTLLTLDQRTEKRNLAQQQADLARVTSELESAKASLLEQELRLKRTRKLFDKNLVSDQELDSAVAGAATARARIGEIEARIMKAKLAVDDASERLEDTVIDSPIDGVIVEKTVERGQIISSGITSVTGGTKLCVIADLSRLFIFALVDETDIGKVQLRQKARIVLDAYPDDRIPAHVDAIAYEAKTVSNVTTYIVDVIPERTPAHMRSGMTANVSFVLAKKKGQY